MEKGLAKSGGLLVLLTMISIFADPAFGQTRRDGRLLEAFRCRRQTEPVSSAAILRSYPFTASSVTIPSEGQQLVNFLASRDGISIAALNRLIQFNDPQFDFSKNKFLVGDKTPNAVLVARGNEVTVFPRSLIVHPLIQSALVQPNDRVATFFLMHFSATPPKDLEPGSPEKAELRRLNSDPVHAWFSNAVVRPTPDQPVAVTIAGNLAPSEVAGDRMFGSEGSFSFNSLLVESEDGGIADELNEFAQTIDPNVPVVVVLRRRVGLNSFRLVIPLVSAGSLGRNSRIYKPYFGDVFSIGNWDSIISPFTNIQLVDGDVIEFVPVYRIPAFSRQ